MATPQILRLDEGVSHFVRATSILKSLGSVVRELIWNSLDAKARAVEIVVDVTTFAVEVRDDGIGMCLDKLGKWDESSKREFDGLTYGYRGQALSAIVELAWEVSIISRQQDCRSAHMKRLVKGEIETDVSEVDPSKNYCGNHGTIINIKNLFHNVPVRQKSTKASAEIFAIKDFIQHMCILHHAVTWTLMDASSNRTLCRLAGELSVGSRFESVHSREALNKMRSVRASYEDFTVEGLLSPPLQDTCHWNRDCQYIYLNGRHFRSSDANFSLLDSAYVQLISISDGRGPAPKHTAPPASRASAHPNFVLQVTCPQDAYDVACEPDKSVAVFTAAGRGRLWHCLALLMRNTFQEWRPELEGALERYLSSGEQALFGVAGARKRGAPAVPSRAAVRMEGNLFRLSEERPDTFLGPFEYVEYGPATPSQSLAHLSPQSRFFHNAFFSSAPGSVDTQTVAPAEDNSSGRESVFQSDFGVEVRRVLTFDDASVAAAPAFVHSPTPVLLAAPADTSCLVVGPADSGARAEVSLSRASLPQLQVVGQLNRSYVLAVSPEGCLFAIDQHAADERSLLEEFGAQLLPHKYGSAPGTLPDRALDLSYLRALPSEAAEGERNVEASRACTLRDRRELFRAWKFEFELLERSESGTQQHCCVRLLRAPVVHGERLTVDDLLEFANSVARDYECSPMLVQPPCVQRILSSHACKAARKFGDALSAQECCALLLRLAETAFPFQCAHGRPTVYPIVNLRFSEMGFSEKITYENLLTTSME